MSVKVTYFVHGTTLDNIEHKSTGWLDGELSEKGIKQSILLRDQINIEDYDIVFCSDLKRAIDSANLTFKDRIKIVEDKRLRECNYGSLNGKDSSLVKYEEHIKEEFPEGESLIDVEKRIKDFCDFLIESYDGKNVAIVAHKAPQMAFQVITEGKTWEDVIENDWRKTKSWQPGWIYNVCDKMNIEEFKKVFIEEAKKNNIYINEEKLDCFYEYMQGILEWNDKVNLTAITNEKMFIVKHFIDSLTVNKYLEDCNSIIDIGTGAGFPGIPLKILNENTKFTLIDSVNKKLNVIRDINDKLKLNSLEIIHTRAEDLANNKEYREMYDIATTRAVSNLSTIVEYMLPFVKVNGLAICMKGPNYQEELEEGKKAIEVLGGKIEKIETVKVDNELERNLIIIRKINKTPNKYPRGQGKPLKEPIR